MTLPIFLALHLAWGALMAHLLMPRMRAEGVVLGVPLLYTLAPVGMVTAPLGAVLLRYAGGWYVHGAVTGNGSIAYERFHLGLLVLSGVLTALVTVGGMFFAIAMLSRDRPHLARAPYYVAAFAALLTVVLDAVDVVIVPGSGGKWLFWHPAGLVSLAVLVVLGAAWRFGKLRVAPFEVQGLSRPPKSIVVMPADL
ncbi:MAG: hypothetical protein IT383_04220 [Deltaproteobacteria bacterium]|nr:hypothetical protein [Deltaproteobacteria bacterium]